MAKVRSGIQKEINKDLVDMGGKAFSAEEYEDNDSAKKLLAMKNLTYVSALTDPLEKAFEYRNYIRSVTQTSQAHDVADIRNATTRTFGLHHKPLIDQIANSAYLLTGMTHTCPECGHTINSDDMQAKIDLWVEYCHIIDHSINRMKINFPTWEKMSKKQKNLHIKSWKSLAKVANMHELNVLIHFVENYGMNQGVLAKAKALLAQQLPNINTLEIAKAVTNLSSLNKPQ
jgi:hypothetical protein